mgnify:CR=1 FL=1
MPRQRMTWEQVDRSLHRIRGMFPEGSRIIEFGISPLTKRISDIYNLQVIERGKLARRWDIDPNIIISTPVQETERGVWFWFPNQERLPKEVELIILHDVDGDIRPASFLEHEFLKKMATDILIFSNRNDKSENLVSEMETTLYAQKKLLINEPDLTIWHLSKTFQKENKYKSHSKIDMITRLFYAAGFRKLARNRIEKIIRIKPKDIRYRELMARLEATPGSWENASHYYEEIHMEAPNYRDVAWQVVRSSIYAARWNVVGRVLSKHPELWGNTNIQNMIEKKLQLIGEDSTNRAIEQIISHRYNPNWLIEKWVNSEFNRNQDLDSPVAKIALERFHGAHIGHEVMQRINLGEIKEAKEIVLKCTSNYGVISTLESICINESLPPLLNDSIREILAECDSKTIHQAIKAIGRRGDPSQFVGRKSISNMIEHGISIQTWMIEFALRSGDRSLLESLFTRGLPGTSSSIVDSLENLIAKRRDSRIVELLEMIAEHKSLGADQRIRRVVSKALLAVAEPILTHAYAMESIRLNPQDAVCGNIALQASIATGNSELILETADTVFAMRSRSSNIDYASVAIAAIRSNQINYAKDLLKRNRLGMDLRAQRIRIGIPFHVENNWAETIDEINLTTEKFRNDPTILIYESLSLAADLHHEAAEEVANKINDPSERAILLYSLRRSWNDYEGALEAWNKPLIDAGMSIMPIDWGDSGFDFSALQNVNESNQNSEGALVSVIMTIHKWNDAFPLAVSSILNQTHEKIELIIVDDFSDESDVQLYDELLDDSRIVRIRMEENVGTYACKNRGIDVARGEFVTFADSDDWNHPERIARSLKIMNDDGIDVTLGRYVRINQSGGVLFNGGRLSRFSLVTMVIRMSMLRRTGFRFDGRARFSADSELFERLRIRLGSDRVKRHHNLDLVALHHNESLTGGGANSIGWTGPGETRLRYVSNYRRYHKKLQNDKSDEGREMKFSPPSSTIFNENETEIERRIRKAFAMTISTPQISGNKKMKNTHIYAFMATYQGGFQHVGDTIRTLLNQTKSIRKIILHVNSKKRPPRLPKDSRLEVIQSSNNIADNGKFAHLSNIEGYILTVDDDINYPPDYVEKMVNEVNIHERKSIVGVHGASLPFGPALSRWSQYKNQRRSHIFSQEHASRIQVDILGTGTVAFHSSLGFPDGNSMNTLKMVDLHFATWAMQNQIPMRLVPRNRNWLNEFEDIDDERIWNQVQEDKELQIQMLQIIQSQPIWPRWSNGIARLGNGPMSFAEKWGHRELPPGLVLPPSTKWGPIPEEPLVTIYIPAYNVRDYIEESVRSALNQTYSRIEVCVHNDGSTDDTLSILERHFGDEKRVRISSAENRGIGAASNQAIDNGSGSIIIQLDGDDTLEPNAIKSLLKEIHDGHVCVYGNFRRINPEGEIIDDGWEEARYSRERLLRSMIIHHPRMFRRDAWEKAGKHDEELTNAVDYDLFLRLSEIGTMKHVREVLYSYRILPTSTSRAKEQIQTRNTLEVVRRSLQRCGVSDFDLHVPNPQSPRSFTIRDKRFSNPSEDDWDNLPKTR